MIDRNEIARLAAEIAPAAVNLRRDLHRRPELGWHEIETTQRVATALRRMGLEPRVGHDGRRAGGRRCGRVHDVFGERAAGAGDNVVSGGGEMGREERSDASGADECDTGHGAQP